MCYARVVLLAESDAESKEEVENSDESARAYDSCIGKSMET